jgi:hypothetical protein
MLINVLIFITGFVVGSSSSFFAYYLLKRRPNLEDEETSEFHYNEIIKPRSRVK